MKAFLALVALVVTIVLQSAAAQPARPLLQEGKQALYQRVIAVPGAGLVAHAGDPASAAAPVTPFTVFYVYARASRDGREWLQVGTESNGRIDGWLPANQGIEWKQALTVGFKDPAVQDRVLLFGDRDALQRLIDTHDVETYRELRRQAEKEIPADSPVIAIQPETYVNIRKDFYLVPILSHQDVLLGAHQGRLLEVATVPLHEPKPAEEYRAGIVFVIDTTTSMGPYIDRTRAIMQRVYDAIDAGGLGDRVRFGLVGFRDNTDAVPALGYVARVYADLGAGGEEFLARMREMKPATVSSRGFNEDVYAGVKKAIDAVDWDEYAARYVIVVTDAGPRAGGDPLSTTGMDTESLRRLALDKGIALWAVHLRTPEGAQTHEFAERHYRRLSHIDGIGDFYYPVITGDVDGFEQALSAMTAQLTAQMREVAEGAPPLPAPEIAAGAPEELAAFQEKAALLGYALRMRYLRRGEGGVPVLFNAWMVDRDFEDPSKRSVDVRVLLTRDQLSDLYEVLRQVLATAEAGALAPQDFLDELKSLAATVSRDPQAVRGATRTVGGTSLADLGYMREYIDGLPYRSEIMTLDLGTWQQWSAQRQFEFINQLDGKIAYYKALHDNVDLWVSLDGGPVDGDSVYPLVLEALP